MEQVHHFQRRANTWFWRRTMAYAMTTFAMTMLTWLAWNGVQDGRLHLLIAEGCLWLLGAIFFIYVAGASADDIITLVKGVRGGGFSSTQTVISSTQTAEKTS